jgi:hypothetical protein
VAEPKVNRGQAIRRALPSNFRARAAFDAAKVTLPNSSALI